MAGDGLSFEPGQLTLTASPQQLSATSKTFVRIVLSNSHATAHAYVGVASDVTTSTGFCVPAGTSVELPFEGDLSGLWAVGNEAVLSWALIR